MKRFLQLVIVTAMILTPNLAQAENEYLTQELLETPQVGEVTIVTQEDKEYLQDDVSDNIETEFDVFDNVGKKDDKYKEETFAQKIFKTKIVRTDIPSYLLKDELTHNFKNGGTIEAFAAHRGSISALFNPHSYSTKYDDLTTEIGFFGKTKDERFDYRFSILPIPKEGKSYVDNLWSDMFITYNKIPHHKILIGRSRGQVGMEGGNSAYTLPFLNRSQIARNFGNLRTTAIKLIGNYEYADYSLSLGSSGRTLTSGMPGLDFIGWFNLKPFGSDDGKYGKLTIGGGLNAGHNNFNYTVGTVYIGYKHKRLWTNFEASIADGYNGGAGLSNKQAGGFAYTVGWKVKPYLQLIGRIDQFDPDRTVSGDTKREYTAGINWFVKGQALRFVLNYVFCQNDNAPDSSRIILGSQIVL